MSEKNFAAKLIVTGIVQKIGYRYFVQRIAEEEHIFGYVKNNFDGSVEIFAECDKNNFERFLSRIKTEHKYARVDEIEIIQQPIHNYSTFLIKY